ncbi:MAG: 26S proteasome regulatory subunit [Monoraphidium minutum]|nr:MAG: 26S proteasome regulatory subunit [Monoraphidium minutum]
MAAGKPLEFIEQLGVAQPALGEDLAELSSLYQRKLWHQLTLKLEECFRKPEFNQGDLPVRLYNGFVADFGAKLNLLRLAHLAVHASKHIKDAPAAVAFLKGAADRVAEWKLPRSEEPLLFLRMHAAQQQLAMGDVADCKAAIEEGAAALERLSEPDPSVSAAVHYVSSLYYKLKKDYARFYRSSMQYLAFVSSDSLAPEFKAPLAVDIALAALLGDGVYGFAQLLMHPIVKALQEGPYAWLGEMLEVFNRGDLPAYDALCVKHAATLNAQPALVENERRLREKVTISCLINLISDLPPEQRSIPLTAIAERTKLTIDGVEFLLMKALSLHLIEGSIDQVDGTVAVSWVQSRVLTAKQLGGLKDRLDVWIGKVNAVSANLEQDSIGVAEA